MRRVWKNKVKTNVYEIKNQVSGHLVFTNGIFDILHIGHVDYLYKAKEMGDILIVGVNSDGSAQQIKRKPTIPGFQRAHVLAGLACVRHW